MSTLQKATDVYNQYGLSELTKRCFSEALRYLSSPYESLETEDRWAGAKYYGNFAGFHNNLGGNLAEFKSRKFSSKSPDSSIDPASEEQEAAVELRHNGYTVLGNIYDSNVINQITTRYNELIEQDECTRVTHTNDPGDGNIYLKGIKSPQEQYFAEAGQLLNDKIKTVLKHYYRSHIQIRSYRAYRTHHIPPEIMENTEVYNDHWHCDGKTSDHIKVFICLSDISEEDGPLHIMPKKYTQNLSRLRPTFDRETDGEPGGIVDENGSFVTLTGRPGTVMLANTQTCLHRAGVPDEGHTRDLIQFYTAPSSTPLPDNWIDQKLEGADPNVWSRLVKY